MENYAGLALGVDVSQVTKAVKSLKDFEGATDKAADSVGGFLNEAEIAKQKAKEFAQGLSEAKKELSSVQKNIDPTVAKLNQLKKSAESLDKLWEKGMIPDDEFFRLGAVLESQTIKLNRTQKALTAEGRAAIEESKAKERANAEGAKFIETLKKQAEYAGMTSREMMEMKAAQLGVSAQAAPMIAKLNAQSKGMKLAGLSAGQYSQAMRMLPAQITDVVTSISSGMPIWMVAIQQGGQIKDSFGGIGNTFKVLLSYLTPTRIALGATVGIMAALGKATYDAYKANQDLSNSLILTGNYASATTGKIKSMVSQIADSTNTSVSAVQDIATKLVKSGKYTGEQIAAITKATVQWSKATGESADEIVDNFDKIAKNPVKGLLELNKTYNFLEKGQLTYIDNLRKTKGQSEAAAAATKIFADVVEGRMNKIAAAANPLEKMWDNIKTWSSNAWRSVGDGMRGALNLIVDVVAGTVEQVQFLINKGDQIIGEFVISATQALQKIPYMETVGDDVINAQQKIVDKAKAQNKELLESIAERDKRIRKGEKGYITDQDNEKSGNQYSSKTKDAVAAEAKAIDELNKKKRVTVDQGDKVMEQYNADIIALKAQLEVLKEHKTVNDSISQQRKTLWNEQAKIKVLEESATHRVLTKEESSLLANKSKILALAEQKAVIGDQIVEQTKLNALQDESFKFVTKMNAQAQAMKDSSGLGDIAANRKRELEAMKADWAGKGGNDDDPALQKMIDARNNFYAQEDAMRSDWLAGGKAAFANYGDAANNMYSNVGQVATSALDGMSTMMTDFLMTGQANFNDFAKSIISMIIKMIMQMTIFNALSGMTGGGGGGFSFAKGFASGGYTGNGGKYTPAGTVHKGEFVFTKEATNRIGVDNLYKIMSGKGIAQANTSGGYASGGYVDGSKAQQYVMITNQSSGDSSKGVNVGGVNVDINNGNDPKGLESGVRTIFEEMIVRACTQGGAVYNYVNGR